MLASLDQGLERHPVGAVGGFIAVGGEVDLGLPLFAADDRVGKPVLALVAEVGVGVVAAVGVDVVDVGAGVGVEGRLGDVLVPGRLVPERGRVGGHARFREDGALAQRGIGPRGSDLPFFLAARARAPPPTSASASAIATSFPGIRPIGRDASWGDLVV